PEDFYTGRLAGCAGSGDAPTAATTLTFPQSSGCAQRRLEARGSGRLQGEFIGSLICVRPANEFNGFCEGSANRWRPAPFCKARWEFERNTHMEYGREELMAEDQQLMCSDCGQSFTF